MGITLTAELRKLEGSISRGFKVVFKQRNHCVYVSLLKNFAVL